MAVITEILILILQMVAETKLIYTGYKYKLLIDIGYLTTLGLIYKQTNSFFTRTKPGES